VSVFGARERFVVLYVVGVWLLPFVIGEVQGGLHRCEAALLYFNVEHVRDAVWQKIRSTTGALKLVVCDLSTSPVVDLAGARMLATLYATLEAMGIRLRLVAAHAAVRDILRAEGLEERVGYFGRRVSVADVIDELQGAQERGLRRLRSHRPSSVHANLARDESW
jgi:ABC-type transporter Mla MlaB component